MDNPGFSFWAVLELNYIMTWVKKRCVRGKAGFDSLSRILIEEIFGPELFRLTFRFKSFDDFPENVFQVLLDDVDVDVGVCVAARHRSSLPSLSGNDRLLDAPLPPGD